MTYTETIAAARSAALADLSPVLRLRLARLLIEELDTVALRYLAGTITEAQARRMVQDIRQALVRYGQRGTAEVRLALQRAARAATGAHRTALLSLLGEQGAASLGLSASFGGIPTRALAMLAVRRGQAAGAGLVYRSLSPFMAARYAGALDRALLQSLARGRSVDEAARSLLKALAGGSGALGGDPDRAYLRAVVDRYGLRGGLRQAAREAGIASDPQAAALARRLGYDARRIARTEVASAFREADNLAALESPVVKGVRHRLSGNHPQIDECDILATADFYGLGPGVYPPGYAPALPHPHCLCFLETVLRDPSEYGDPKPSPSRPALRGALEVPLPGLTAGARGRAVRNALVGVSEAWRSVQGLAERRRIAA